MWTLDHAFFIGPDGFIQEVYQYKSIQGNDDSILVLTGIQDGMEVWEEKPAVVYVLETPGEGFYKPKWVDGKWTEGLTAEEIDTLRNVPTPLSVEEQLDEKDKVINRLENQLSQTNENLEGLMNYLAEIGVL